MAGSDLGRDSILTGGGGWSLVVVMDRRVGQGWVSRTRARDGWLLVVVMSRRVEWGWVSWTRNRIGRWDRGRSDRRELNGRVQYRKLVVFHEGRIQPVVAQLWQVCGLQSA